LSAASACAATRNDEDLHVSTKSENIEVSGSGEGVNLVVPVGRDRPAGGGHEARALASEREPTEHHGGDHVRAAETED
jgi:hypothetical protein